MDFMRFFSSSIFRKLFRFFSFLFLFFPPYRAPLKTLLPPFGLFLVRVLSYYYHPHKQKNHKKTLFALFLECQKGNEREEKKVRELQAFLNLFSCFRFLPLQRQFLACFTLKLFFICSFRDSGAAAETHKKGSVLGGLYRELL